MSYTNLVLMFNLEGTNWELYIRHVSTSTYIDMLIPLLA